MFVKIVRNDVRVDSLYECHRLHIHWKHEGEPLHLDLQTNSSEQTVGGNYGITIDWPDPTVIYIMNDRGQTIDKIEHLLRPDPPPAAAGESDGS